MVRGLCLLLVATVCLAGGVRAQTVDVPPTYAIPLPPLSNPGPQWELGMRYWWSEGGTRFDIDSSNHGAIYGNPTSTLTYDGINANALEFVFSARNETRTFTKGFVGGGWLVNGSLDDEDFLAGQVKISDTYSRADGDDLVYGTIDVGQDFVGRNVVFSPFVGFNYWEEDVKTFGVRCNPDDVPNAYSWCGAPGSVPIPFGTDVIGNKSQWYALRLGAEVTVKLWDIVTLRGDAAALPVAYLFNEDSHYLRYDLGSTPNIKDSGTGWGYQLEGEVRLDLTQAWAVGAGVRYWYAQTSGESDWVHFDTTSRLKDFTSDRFGVFGNAVYRFNTF